MERTKGRHKEAVDEHFERTIIIGLIVSDDYIKYLAKALPTIDHLNSCFGSSTAKLIASWCFEYYREYNKAPKLHIQDIFYDVQLHVYFAYQSWLLPIITINDFLDKVYGHFI